MTLHTPRPSRLRRAVASAPRMAPVILAGLTIVASPVPARAQAGLPDLVVDEAALAATVRVVRRTFDGASCAVEEGCVSRTGSRRLLAFATVVGNVGRSDLRLGPPGDAPERFRWSPCHGHFHLSNFATYRLRTARGQAVQTGRKQAFCLLDLMPYVAGANPEPRYDCDHQGISAGWADVYDEGLDCQWLDVTDVRPGTYILEVEVNPGGAAGIRESSYANNKAIVMLRLDARTVTVLPRRIH